MARVISKRKRESPLGARCPIEAERTIPFFNECEKRNERLVNR